MTRLRGSLEISRPVDEVFGVLLDLRNEPAYNSAMTSVVLETGEPIGVGSRFRATMVSGGRTTQTLVCYTEVDPPRRLASRSTTMGTVVEGAVRCDPAESGTRLSWDWRVRLPGLLRLAGPLVRVLGRRQERRIWTSLKRRLEQERP